MPTKNRIIKFGENTKEIGYYNKTYKQMNDVQKLQIISVLI